ncbi:MAG: hypothetical protein MI974_08545 [Chitinophagales bacterium]|nr:hypothetical protein [Chitinophagales bacterium]
MKTIKKCLFIFGAIAFMLLTYTDDENLIGKEVFEEIFGNYSIDTLTISKAFLESKHNSGPINALWEKGDDFIIIIHTPENRSSKHCLEKL